MKKKLLIVLGALALIILVVALYGALVVSKRSPIKTETFSGQGLDIKVVYCQPYKKGRLIFGDERDGALQPYGKYWRLGANAATEITFSKDINFAGQPINAGTYRMYAVPGADAFQVALNGELGVYFAIREPNYEMDVLKVSVPASQAASEFEQFTIGFASDSTGIKMNMMWDKTVFTVPIAVQGSGN